MSDLPAYVIDGNVYDALNWVRLDGVTMHNFCVQADETKIQAWLDKTFSTPSGGAVRYEAIGGKIFLGIAEIAELRTYNDGKPALGYTSEIDITIWILARRLDDGLLALRWIPAYLFVNSGPALVSGREVWGFPKQLGQFDFSPRNPADPAGPRTFAANGWVVSPYGPNSPARWAPMFEARPKIAPVSPGRGTIIGSLEALARTAVSRLTDGMTSISGALSMAMGMGGITMAMLKQFPDASRPTLACYQAVIEAAATITTLRGGGLTEDDYEVRIVTYDTHPYLDELGIGSDWQDVGQAMWMDFDFRQDLGATIWPKPV